MCAARFNVNVLCHASLILLHPFDAIQATQMLEDCCETKFSLSPSSATAHLFHISSCRLLRFGRMGQSLASWVTVTIAPFKERCFKGLKQLAMCSRSMPSMLKDMADSQPYDFWKDCVQLLCDPLTADSWLSLTKCDVKNGLQ